MPMARPGSRSTSRPGRSRRSRRRCGSRRTGPMPGSITASRATGRAISRTPRRAMRQALARRARPCRRRTANLGAFMRITGEAEAAEALLRAALARGAGQRRRPAQSRRRPAAGGARRPRRWRCSTQRRVARRRSARGAALAAAAALALLQLGRAGGGAAGARRARSARAHPAGDGAALALAARAAGARPSAIPRAPAREAARMETALGGDGRRTRCRSTASWRITIWRSSGRARATTAARVRALARRATRCCARSSRSRAPSTPRSSTPTSPLLTRARFAAGPRAAQRRSGAGVHRRHAALGHDAVRADPGRACAGARRRRADRRSAERFGALGGGAGRGGGRGASPRSTRRRWTRRRPTIWRSCTALAPDKARIVDKMPGNYLYLGLVGLMLPGARIIHCVRDPRDIGLSIFTFRFHGHHAYAHDLGRSRLDHRRSSSG